MWACPFPSAVSVKSLCHLEVAGSSRSSAGTQSLGCQDDVATLWHCMQILQLQIWQALTIYGRSLSNMTSLTTSVVFFQVSRKTGVLFGREQRPVLWTVVRWLSHAAQRSQAKKPDPEKLLLSVGKLHKLHYPPNQFTQFTPRQARQVPVVHQVHVQLPEARPNSVWCMPPPSTTPSPNTNSRPARDLRDWAQSFPWDQEVNEALPKFGVPAFRPQQREAINACLAGKDVFVRMPTGGDLNDLTTWTHYWL